MVKYENNIINYVLLALICMNFMQSGSLILVIFCLYNLFFLKDDRFDGLTMLLFLMSLSMIPSLFSLKLVGINDFIKIINFFFPYYIGYNGYRKAIDKPKYIKRTLFAMFTGYSLQIILDYFYNLLLSTEGRVMISVWTDERITVTLIGLISSFVIGYSFAVILTDKAMLHKISCFAVMIVTVLINMQTATRTPFLMMALMALVFLFVLIFQQDGTGKRKQLMIFAVIIIALLAAIYFNMFGLKDFIFSSSLFDRFENEGLETPRGEVAMFYFNNMLKYPWGGGKATEIYGIAPHNIWQQMYDDYGCVPAVLLLFFTVSSIKSLIVIVKFQNKQTIDYILIGLYVASLVQMGLEPVLTGYPILFWGFIFIHGITKNYVKDRTLEPNLTTVIEEGNEI